MPNPYHARQHEIEFCADVKSWAEALFTSRQGWPFTEAKIEQFGRGTTSVPICAFIGKAVTRRSSPAK